MDHKIVGTTLPVLEMTLQPGDSIIAEPGELSWMMGNIQLRTSTQGAGAKNLFGVLKRAIAGGGLFLTEYSAQGGSGLVAFAAKLPGQILAVDVQRGRGYMIHRHGFVCATPGVEVTVGFQRSLGAGIFGGDGFVLQRLGGTANAFIELSGEVVVYDLLPGQELRVHPGHVGMFEESINFDITMVPGIANALFGNQGLFLARLVGPGRVWLQSLTLPNLAHALRPYVGRETAPAAAVSGGVGGAVAGQVFKDILGQ
ncbi:MAG: TIGR00266 family protein [Candidatus Eremiobacteraeota bacterium]|nr:TIGR00266 family protein [Candidatus Eremiobacteraeota bacterium]MBC5826901.1 TIGR00266 family protein [Candidatus Eremiobacteraeota bacterium]